MEADVHLGVAPLAAPVAELEPYAELAPMAQATAVPVPEVAELEP